MFEFAVMSIIGVGIIEEVILPVGSYAIDQASWAAHQVSARLGIW